MGVVFQHGATTEHGHCTAACKTSHLNRGAYARFDDAVVTSSSWQGIAGRQAQQEAVILLYVRIERHADGQRSAPCAVGSASRSLLAHAGGGEVDIVDEDRIARQRESALRRRSV